MEYLWHSVSVIKLLLPNVQTSVLVVNEAGKKKKSWIHVEYIFFYFLSLQVSKHLLFSTLLQNPTKKKITAVSNTHS